MCSQTQGIAARSPGEAPRATAKASHCAENKMKPLSLREKPPHHASPGWWYEKSWGISVYTEHGVNGVTKILWRNLLPAANRAAHRALERTATAKQQRQTVRKAHAKRTSA